MQCRVRKGSGDPSECFILLGWYSGVNNGVMRLLHDELAHRKVTRACHLAGAAAKLPCRGVPSFLNSPLPTTDDEFS